jgi:hypothetical protein
MKTLLRVLVTTASIAGVGAMSLQIAQAQSSAQQQVAQQWQQRQQRALRLVSAARSQVGDLYDQSYYSLPYPNGDVPRGRGACTDVVVRAYVPSDSICNASFTKTSAASPVFIRVKINIPNSIKTSIIVA